MRHLATRLLLVSRGCGTAGPLARSGMRDTSSRDFAGLGTFRSAAALNSLMDSSPTDDDLLLAAQGDPEAFGAIHPGGALDQLYPTITGGQFGTADSHGRFDRCRGRSSGLRLSHRLSPLTKRRHLCVRRGSRSGSCEPAVPLTHSYPLTVWDRQELSPSSGRCLPTKRGAFTAIRVVRGALSPRRDVCSRDYPV